MQLGQKIGIIGAGFVGGAIAKTLNNPVIVDIDPSRGQESYADIMACRGIFVCVPSPSRNNGECDADILVSVLEKLSDYSGVIISKVTAPPDIYKELSNKYENLVYVPEFLTASNACADYANSTFAIIGGRSEKYIVAAADIIKLSINKNIIVSTCSVEEASMAKYLINSFLAIKVVFMNEMKALADIAEINFENIVRNAMLDLRLGNSHNQVPGPDGKFGFGGSCFPKDTRAIVAYSKNKHSPLSLLDEAVKINDAIRVKNNS